MEIPFKVPISIEYQRMLRADSNKYNVNFSHVDLIIGRRSHRKAFMNIHHPNTNSHVYSILTQKSSSIMCVLQENSLNGSQAKKENAPTFPYTVSDKCVFYFYQSRPFMNIRLLETVFLISF
jgi:hypothetical protein